jgi:integrase
MNNEEDIISVHKSEKEIEESKESVEELIDKRLRLNKPIITLSTIKTYRSSIRIIARNIEKDIINPEDIKDHIDAIVDYLKPLNVNNRKTKTASLVVFIDNDDYHFDGKDETLKILRDMMHTDIKKIAEKDLSQVLTAKQKKNFISWPEVLKIYADLERLVEPFFKKKMKVNERFIAQKYVLLSMYVLLPPRRITDYLNMKIKGIDKKLDNYMLLKRKPPLFVFNVYKNATRIGEQRIEVPQKLVKILKTWLSDARSDYLFTNHRFNKPSPSFITRILNEIFDKNISVSMLRHIYLTHKFGSTDLEELEKTTRAMGNSKISRSLAYVSKEHKDKKDE